MTNDQHNLRDCLWLCGLYRQAGLAPADVRGLMNRFGSIDNMMTASPDSVAEAIIGPPDKVSRLRTFLKNARIANQSAELAGAMTHKGIRALSCKDPDFPRQLLEIAGCPPVLFYRGQNFAEMMSSQYKVTIIGTRTPTPYGRAVTRRIAGELAEQGVLIISGMARGIDAEAHQAALRAKGRTIAVLGCGPDYPYPAEHAGLMDQIADNGLIVSEYPPGVPPRRQHFPARNRILSGLADAVAVIEASHDSGSMITAGFAAEQGKDVFAVPGSILSPFSQGCNQLIKDGAEVLTSAADLLWRLPVGLIQTRIEQAARAIGREDEADSATMEETLIHALTGHDMTLAELSECIGFSFPGTASCLTRMEISGRVCCEKGRYALTSSALCCNNS